MIRFKHKTTGEQHIVANDQRHAYPIQEWEEVEAEIGRQNDETAVTREQASIMAMTPVERYEAIMGRLKALEARVAVLERNRAN
jgi:hypothetical protein